MNADEKVQRILRWRESFSTLPEKLFFDLVRIYLGEVKTPYNKQKIMEQIGSLLRKQQTRDAIIKYLSEQDIQILQAIKFLHDPDVFKLESFFAGAIQQGQLFTAIASLEERLVIFSSGKNSAGRNVISINPYLEEDLEPILTLRAFADPQEGKDFASPKNKLSVELLALLICYVAAHPEFSKSSGEFKRKATSDLKEIFGDSFDKEFLEKLSASLKALGILKADAAGKEYSVDWQLLQSFAELAAENQIAYLCAAGAGGTQDALYFGAKNFFETFAFLGGGTFLRQKVVQVAFWLCDEDASGRGNQGRLSQMMRRGTQDALSFNKEHFEKMIDTAVGFGYLETVTEGTKEYVRVNPAFITTREQKKISIDAGFCVTIFPGLSLSEFVPLVKFLEPKKCDVTLTFEVTKNSCMRAFSCGMGKEDITSLLERLASYSIPQNLAVSLEEWFALYSSASLYKGYVLKVDPESCAAVQKKLGSHIIEKLAAGVFLLNFASDEEAREELSRIGLGFAANVKNLVPKASPLGFAKFEAVNKSWQEQGQAEAMSFEPLSKDALDELLEGFRSKLEELSVTPEQKEGLEDRINRRTILNADQLKPQSVKFELTEAGGMNFAGKIRVIESAIQNANLVEVEMSRTKEILVGLPKSIAKDGENTTARLSQKTSENTSQEIEIAVASIARVKRIRNSASLSSLF